MVPIVPVCPTNRPIAFILYYDKSRYTIVSKQHTVTNCLRSHTLMILPEAENSKPLNTNKSCTTVSALER